MFAAFISYAFPQAKELLQMSTLRHQIVSPLC